MNKDTVTRSIVKTIFFKIITTSITAIFTGVKGAILIHAILTVVYLLYERLWNNISWGKTKLKTAQNQKHEFLRNAQDWEIPTLSCYRESMQN